MITDLQRRLDAACESIESTQADFDQAAQCLAESLAGIHERMERIELWIETKMRKMNKRKKEKVRKIFR